MRVLFLNHNVAGSGTYFRAFHFARQLSARGHGVTLVTTSRLARWRPRVSTSDNLDIIEAPDLFWGRARTGWDPYNTLRRIALLRGRPFDIVHAFDSRPAVIYPALSVARQNEALLVMDWADWWGRGGWINERSGWFVRRLFGPIETWFEEAYRTRAAGITTISRALARRSIALGVAPERVTCIPHGCDANGWILPSHHSARTQLGLASAAALIVHVGVLTRGDLALLRESFIQVRRIVPDARLALVGRTAIRVRSHDAGVIVTGPVSLEQLHTWLAAADVCVVPCRDTIGNRGRWPSKLNDYLSAGKAVVMPHVGDAADLIAETGAGWTCAADANAFAETLLAALSDRSAAEEAGEKARRTAQERLAWPRLTEELLGFYARLRVSA